MGWKPMPVQAVRWALLGALFAGTAVAAAAPATIPAPDSFPVATDARLGGDATQTRFVMDLDRTIDLHVFTLADPYRLVLDIPQVTFQLPPHAGESGRGLIKAFRFGLVMPGGSRMVFDLSKPVRVDKAFVMACSAGRAGAAGARPRRHRSRELLAHDGARGEIRPQGYAVAARGAAGIERSASSCRSRSRSRRHRHRTRAPDGECEKDIVLAFAKRLRDTLEKSGKYRVLMTRSDDTFVALPDRVQIARQAGAALFISVHADFLPHKEGDAEGATVYTLSDTPSDPQAARVAAEENRADVIAGVDLKDEPADVAGILLDLAQRETKTFSVQFAHKLVGDLKTVTHLNKDPVRSAGFRVLRSPDVPSVLIELGYVSNKRDLQSLNSDNWRDRTADSIASAVDDYFATHLAGARAN